MTLPAAARNNANSFADSFLPTLTTRQATYKSSNGRYFQGLRTMDDADLAPGGGNATPKLNRKPSDQAVDWTTMVVGLAAQWPVSMEVQIYVGPAGDGFTLVLEVKGTSNEFWRRTINVGPETWREHDWRLR